MTFYKILNNIIEINPPPPPIQAYSHDHTTDTISQYLDHD